MNFSLASIPDIENIRKKLEANSRNLDDIVADIISPYCKSLDEYVQFIQDCLSDEQNPPTNEELDDFCLNLSTLIYFSSGGLEQLGVRDDIGKAIYKESYNSARMDINKGTVADKDTQAELLSEKEHLTSVCYTRAYKTMKSKIDAAQEILTSVKKVISRRMQEIELTKIGGN